jgi:hypothetical protein
MWIFQPCLAIYIFLYIWGEGGGGIILMLYTTESWFIWCELQTASVWHWMNVNSNGGLQSTRAWVRIDGLWAKMWTRDLQTTDLLTKYAKHSTYCYLPVSDTARLLVDPSKSEIRNLFKYRHIVILIPEKMPFMDLKIYTWLCFSHIWEWKTYLVFFLGNIIHICGMRRHATLNRPYV